MCCPDCLTKYLRHDLVFLQAIPHVSVQPRDFPGLAHDHYPNEAALMPVSIAYRKQRPPLPALRRIPQYRISAVILAPLQEIASVKAYLGCVKQTTQRRPTPCPEIMVEPDCEHSRVFKQFIGRIPWMMPDTNPSSPPGSQIIPTSD